MTFPSLPSGSPDRGSPGPWFAMAGIVVIAVLAVVAVAQAQLPGIPRGLGAAMPSGVLVAVVEPTASPDAPAPASLGPIRGGGPDATPLASSGPGGSPSAGGCSDPPAGVLPAPVAFHGSRAQKVVALTFDDGWDATTTGKILAILRRDRVNATFFPVGHAIELQPAAWRAVAKAGFPIGDHTYDHKDLTTMCFASQVGELTRQQSVVTGTLGVTELPVMRPPFGAQNGLTQVAATAAGDARVVLWDVDSRDWAGLSQTQIASRALGGGNGSIILMHTFAPNTAIALPRIIAGYRARGYRFVTIGQLLGVPGAVPFPTTAGHGA